MGISLCFHINMGIESHGILLFLVLTTTFLVPWQLYVDVAKAYQCQSRHALKHTRTEHFCL